MNRSKAIAGSLTHALACEGKPTKPKAPKN
jgi:hypothetical protein